jgi:hypothetical protein
MGITIFCKDETAPYPRPLVLALTCDGEHGLLPATVEHFEHPGGFIAQHAMAMKAGWLERGNGERLWFGPCCSGKRVVEAVDRESNEQ